MATVEFSRVTKTQNIKKIKSPDVSLSVLPGENKHYQTLQWQTQNHSQNGDIQGVTRTNTLPAKFSSDMDLNLDDVTPMWQPQLDELNTQLAQTRSVRVREALFPETIDDGTYVLQTAIFAGHTTAVQKLAEPAQSLKQAIVNLINYQEDADVALVAAPAIAELLRACEHGDMLTTQRAAMLAHQLSRKQACRLAFSTCAELVRALVILLQISVDDETLRFALGTLGHISRSKTGALLIFECQGIPELVRLLSHRQSIILDYALTTLHNIVLMGGEAVRSKVRLTLAVSKLAALLGSSRATSNIRFLALVVDCLQLLAFNNAECKLDLFQCDVIPHLIRILRQSNYEKLLFVTVRLIKVLSICPTSKPVLIELGAMQALGDLLVPESTPRLVMNVLWSTRNLSDQAFSLSNVENLLLSLIDLLSSVDTDYVTCACGILCNLTCDNPNNKSFVVRSRGIEALVDTLIQYQDREEISEPIVCALRHCTHRHDLQSEARVLVRNAPGGALFVIVQLLDSPASRWPLLKALAGLCRNLALDADNCIVLREYGVVACVVGLLIRSHNDRRGSIATQSDFSFQEGIRLEDVIEACLAALQILARDPLCRSALRSTATGAREGSLAALMVQLLYSDNEFIQRAAAGYCSAVAVDIDCARQLEAEGATARLTELLHSRNQSLATYAATVLYRLAQDKPADYRSRLLSELEQSLNRVDPAAQIMSNSGVNLRQDTWGNADAFDPARSDTDHMISFASLSRGQQHDHAADSWHQDLDV